MVTDSDLLFVVLAVRLGFAAPVSPEQAEALEESLAPAARAAVRSAVAAHIAAASGDTARALDSLRNAASAGRTTSGVRKAPETPENRFKLGVEIGRGPWGPLVAARDVELDRDVVVRVVPPGVPEERRERVVREAKLLARLEHPNILPVHGLVRSAGGAPMLALRRVRGRTLSSVIRDLANRDAATEAAWPRARLLAAFEEVCRGVAFAHSRAVINRNLTPEGVMLGDLGEALIVDWLSAQEKGAAAPAPHPGEPAPDPAMAAYRAPELAAGREDEVDERTDVYALGAILYEILVFSPPAEPSSPGESSGKPKSTVRLTPSKKLKERDPKAQAIPRVLDAIVQRALATRREDRFPSAADLHRDIRQYLEGNR